MGACSSFMKDMPLGVFVFHIENRKKIRYNYSITNESEVKK